MYIIVMEIVVGSTAQWCSVEDSDCVESSKRDNRTERVKTTRDKKLHGTFLRAHGWTRVMK